MLNTLLHKYYSLEWTALMTLFFKYTQMLSFDIVACWARVLRSKWWINHAAAKTVWLVFLNSKLLFVLYLMRGLCRDILCFVGNLDISWNVGRIQTNSDPFLDSMNYILSSDFLTYDTNGFRSYSFTAK